MKTWVPRSPHFIGEEHWNGGLLCDLPRPTCRRRCRRVGRLREPSDIRKSAASPTSAPDRRARAWDWAPRLRATRRGRRALARPTARSQAEQQTEPARSPRSKSLPPCARPGRPLRSMAESKRHARRHGAVHSVSDQLGQLPVKEAEAAQLRLCHDCGEPGGLPYETTALVAALALLVAEKSSTSAPEGEP